jgi:hypothetical protein
LNLELAADGRDSDGLVARGSVGASILLHFKDHELEDSNPQLRGVDYGTDPYDGQRWLLYICVVIGFAPQL